jgi:uncharacterized protein (TIGR02246 family)
MTTRTYNLLAVSAALGIATMASAAEARDAHRERCVAVTEEQVNAQFARFNEGFQTRDPDVMTALFSENAVLLPTVSGRMRTDAAGIRDYFVSFLPNRPFGTITESETTLGCNIATRVGNWTVQLTNPTTGVTNDVPARFSFIYTYEDGAWKIAHLHSSARPAN